MKLHTLRQSFRRALGLIGLILALVTIWGGAPLAQAASNPPVSFNQAFTGRVSYAVTGASLIAVPDTAPCSVKAFGTASLTGLPAGANIRAAYLVWTGSGTAVSSNTNNTVNFNAGTAAPSTPYTADSTDTYTFTGITPNLTWFRGFKNVTSAVTGNGSYSFSIAPALIDVSAPYCSVRGLLDDWALIVFYDDATQSNSVINFYTGFQGTRNASVVATLSNFLIPSPVTASDLTLLVWQGDRTLAGDSLTIKSSSAAAATTLSNACNPTGNIFNGTISTPTTVCTNMPAAGGTTGTPTEQFEIDLDTYNVTNSLAAGDTSATVTATTQNDLLIFDSFILRTPSYLPDLRIAKIANGPWSWNQTGAQYTLSVSNTSSTSATFTTNGTVTVRDTLPPGITFNGTPSGIGWTCSTAGQNLTCTTTTVIGKSASGNNIIIPVNVTATASTAGVTNYASIGGGGDSIASAPTPGAACTPTDHCTSVTTPVSASYNISGQVFEDFNYGGGAGRAYSAASGMSLRPSVRAELYTSAGTFVAATFTDASGAYSFPGQLPGNYTVRAVNSFVTSSRGGGCTAAANVTTPPAGCTQLPVQTYVNGDVNRVGGEIPSGADPALSTTTLPAGAESVAAITVGSANVSSVDFGFNFDTVVNKNPSGQGSLGQFITNASALNNTGLVQSGSRQDFGAVQALPAGVETSIFMASGGTAVPGLRVGLPSQLTSGVLLLDQSAASLPSETGANAASTSIDGTTQTVNVGNTNSGLLGTGGTVGYIVTAALGQVQRPEVEIVGAAARPYGLDLQSANDQVRGLSVRGFGSAANNPNSANIHIGAVSGSVIEQNFAGFAATATTLCDTTTLAASGTGDNLRSDSGTNGVVRGNIIACSAGKGFGVETASTGWLIENNEIRGNGFGNPTLDGIDLENAGTANNTVRGNLVTANGGVGVDGYQGGGSNLIERNTVTGNGVAQASVPGETPGVRIYSSNNTIQNNVIALNYGAGVMVTGAVSGNRISQNSIYDNGTVASAGGGAGTVTAASGQIGIDLLAAAEDVSKGASPYVTKNDAGDADTGGNGLLNFPVFSGASLNPSGTTLTLSGFARPGSLIELFIAAADGSGFGEGKTYLTTVQEGSAADLDSGTGTYTTTAGTDITNRFRFSLALSSLPGVGIGTVLTATATCLSANGCTDAPTGSTSEFSFNVPATGTPLLNLVKQERNCGPIASGALCTGTFVTDVTVKPADVIEYCIDYTNTGNAAASSVLLTDLVPGNTTADLNGYGTGKGVSVTTGGTTTLYTSASDGDIGSLTAAQMSLSVPSLATSSTGRVCFRAAVR